MADLTPMEYPTSPEVEMLRRNKTSGFNYRERRQSDWDENYTLSRDKVVINRLTQRQSVNLPLMKTVLRTTLKDIDDMPVILMENLSNDKQKEVFLNEYWKWTLDVNNAELQDIVDKKQELMFGRTFDQWQIVDGRIKFTIQDPEDILVDRYVDPVDLDTARYLIHTHIFKPLSVIADDPNYDKEAIKRLRSYFATTQGLIKAADNNSMLVKRNEKLKDLGVPDVDSPVLGETYVELSLHFVMHKEKKEEEEQYYLYVECQDMEILMKKPLEKVIGVTKENYWRTHLPYNSWADDVERQDFWSDGLLDGVRTPNKVLNSFFSQLIENRTMRNFNMHYYNSGLEGFTPQTFNPVAWGWYGIPVPAGGKIDDVLKTVEIPDLSESLDEMNFITAMVEKATGATSTQQGVQTAKQITLGEVKLALNEAKERIKGISKYYTPVWKKRAEKFLMLIEAGADKLDAVRIYKKGKNSQDLYSQEVGPNNWKDESGYRVRIWSQEEKSARDTDSLQKLDAVKANMPYNSKLGEIYKRKLLEFADLPPEDINDVMEEEKQMAQGMAGAVGFGQIPPAPQMQQQLPVQAPQVV